MIFNYFETNFPRYHFNFTLSEDEMHNVVPKRIPVGVRAAFDEMQKTQIEQLQP